MLKKTMTYTDFNGEERTEDFYFNITKAELVELEHGVDGGLSGELQRMIAAKDAKKTIETFKHILFVAYGEKAPDGRRFMKSQEISRSFAETEAYSDLFMDLATNAEHAAAFIKAIVPKETGA